MQRAVHVIKRIQKEFLKPFYYNEHEIFISSSIGIVECTDYSSAEEILRDADTAMYHAKSSGKNCYKIFTGEIRHLNLV